jgi:hypothetical protein
VLGVEGVVFMSAWVGLCQGFGKGAIIRHAH